MLPEAVAIPSRLALERHVRVLGCSDGEIEVRGKAPIRLVGIDTGQIHSLVVIEIAHGAEHRDATIPPLMI